MSASPSARSGGLPGAPTIEPLSGSDEPAWDTYAAGHARASLYHQAAWRHLITRLFGHDTHYLLARDTTGTIAGILPLVRLKSVLFGDFLVSVPYVNYGGAIAAEPSIEHALMVEAGRLAADLGADHVEFRDMLARPSGDWAVRTDKAILELSLPESPEALFGSFDPKLRAQIRRPLKEGAHVVHGGAELLPEFYRVFARSMRDLGTPVYPRAFFEAILDAFLDAAVLVLVRLDGRAAAAGLCLSHRGRFEIPWAASVRRYNRLGVNMLLYWQALQYAIETGHAVFDFGRSTRGGGTYRFKRQWGAQPRQCHWHYWLPPGSDMPALTPENPKYRLAVRVWQNMPLSLTKLLGPKIVGYLP